MPTYEYECSSCGEKFEKFQSIKDAPIKKCAACGKLTARRLISAGAGIIFKGSGFYETDYKRAGNSGANKDGTVNSEVKKDNSAADTGADTGADTAKSAAGAETAKTAPAEKTAANTKPTEKPVSQEPAKNHHKKN